MTPASRADASPRELLRLAQDFDSERKQSRQRDDGEDEHVASAPSCGTSSQLPRKKSNERDRHKAAPQIVENFPPRQRRDRIANAATLRAAEPAATATARSASRRESSDAAGRRRSRSATDIPRKVHVAHQAAAGVDRLEQIVAQNSILRETTGERALESIDVVDAFADERAFVEKILIHIRDRARVGIDPDFAGVQPNESGTVRARQAHVHPRLQNAVAFGHNPARGSNAAGSTDAPSCRPVGGLLARQLRVGIEGDDVFDFGQNRGHPTTAAKQSAQRPRRKALNCISFPRFRS